MTRRGEISILTTGVARVYKVTTAVVNGPFHMGGTMTTTTAGFARHNPEARRAVIDEVAENGFGPIESNDPEQLRTDLDCMQMLLGPICAELVDLRRRLEA